ncbi:MAG: hypothetical protein DIU56_012640 [Pseudomonadota bacterium]
MQERTATTPAACVCGHRPRVAELLEAAVQDSLAPVAALAGAFARMQQAIAACGEELAPSVAAHVDQLERDIALCIESLQFHDRLVQQLALVQRHLDGDAPPPGTGFDHADEAGQRGSIELF